MAVVQISRIQARRGLQQDLPTLASAEFGWSVDQRRLYIGNGTLTEGAPTEGVTEILTQYTDLAAVLKNYIFRGNAGGYTTQTGSSLLSPTVRSFQDKLDDAVNVMDFGAKGDGVTDDTIAINRAITQIYLSTRLEAFPQVRRTIKFPAGTYKVSSVIYVPPYARFVGDGIESTIIKQTNSASSCVVQFTDSLYQTGASLGQNGATLPTDIVFEHMTLKQDNDKDVVIIDSAKHITFFNVELKGSLSNPTTAGSSAYAAVRVLSYATTTTNVNFWSCRFENTRYVVLSDDAGSDVRLNGCLIAGVYKGLRLGQNSSSVATTPGNYKILNCVFASVANTAIDCYANVSGIVSSGNHYIDVGNNFAGGGSPVAPVISFLYVGNYSVNDTFNRNDTDNATQPRVNLNNTKNILVQANVGFTTGTYTVGSGNIAILADNTATALSSNITLLGSCLVNYTITRGGALRAGTINYVNDAVSGQSYSDNSVGFTGVTLNISAANVITYTTTSTGNDAIMRYNINYFS